jgi:hypothetical protein
MPGHTESKPAHVCGVKFCGGCNPGYDRRRAFETVRDHFQGKLLFEFAEEGASYDLLLYIAGCSCRCTALAAYKSTLGTFVLWEKDGVCEILDNMGDL